MSYKSEPIQAVGIGDGRSGVSLEAFKNYIQLFGGSVVTQR